MKKIEPGCKVMIVRSIMFPEKIGMIYCVNKFAGNRVRRVTGSIGSAWYLSDGEVFPWDEECLILIDDDANLEYKESQREKSWNQ